MSTIGLAGLHAKYNLIETLRVPIAIIGSLVFPALALLFFVVPNQQVAQDTMLATSAVISLSVFAIMSNSLFSFGLTIAENREKPWEPYLRTLPAPAGSRVLGLVFATGLMSVLALIPVVAVGGLFTSADAELWRIGLGILAIAVAGLPFMFIGTIIGYAMPMKAAIAVIQIIMFGFAFIGGLFLPPQMFPGWLNTISEFTPSRAARDFVVWTVQGGDLAPLTIIVLAAWTVATFALAVVLVKRDEGRRFR